MVPDFESIHYVVQHVQQKVKGKSVHKPFALPWMGCKSIARLAPTFQQTSLIICQDPFILLGGERERERERGGAGVLWEWRVLPKNTTHSPNQVLDPDLLTQNSVHWQVEHCVFSLGVATPSPKVAQGLPRLHFTFVEGRVLLLVGYCIFHKWPTRMFYTHLIPFVMLYLPCHLEEQHHPICHLHISLLVWKVYTSYIQVYLKK